MASTKFSGLTGNVDPQGTDIIPMIDDPGGTPTGNKITLDDLYSFMAEGIFGNMYEYSSANSIVVTTAGTYYGWITVAGSSVSGMTVDLGDATADHFTIVEPGEYEVMGSFAFGGDNNAIIQGAVHVDGTINADSPRFIRTLGTVDIGSTTISGVTTLTVNEEVSMRFTSDSDGDTIAIKDFSLNIRRVHTQNEKTDARARTW